MNNVSLYGPKRLIEVDLPIRKISEHARREKSIRHGHISTLHIWWARRPLAACRAVILAALWPDPADPNCPAEFLREAASRMRSLRDRRGGPVRDWSDPSELRSALLDFIADFANWDLSNEKDYLETSQALVEVAHRTLGGPGARPLVVDPFAGGGTIPLEALRVGADAFASDLNPVAVLMNRVSLEFIPKNRERLAEAVRKWGRWVNETAAKELASLYPPHPDGSKPIAYLWARTIKCEGPACGADVPLLRSLWLARKGNRSVAIRLVKSRFGNSVDLEVVEGARAGAVGSGTVARGSATCPLCGYTTRVERVRLQLRERRGGTQDARLYCTVVKTPAGSTEYRAPTPADIRAVEESRERLAVLRRSGVDFGAQELPPDGALGFRVQKYGITRWREVFTHRQMLMLSTYASIIRKLEISDDPDLTIAGRAILGLTISKMANFTSSLCAWRNVRSCVRNTFGSQTLSMVWDFGEMNPYAGSAGDFSEGLDYLDRFIAHTLSGVRHEGSARQADASSIPLPDDAASLFFTDPPYYDAIPYAHLSGYFATWLEAIGVLPNELDGATTTGQECIVDPGLGKNAAFFERKMGDCLRDGRRVAHPQSLGVVVFAHKSTAGWEAQLQAMLDAGWVVTASWPIDTERAGRLRAIESAALASSVHLVCRPREDKDGSVRADDVGDWREILQELPRRIHEWLPRLAEEGIVGADAIFACLGPALEVFSRYARVEKVSGEVVPLREYLEHVWAAVSREALSMIFDAAETAGLEEDARLTAMWLWTLAAPGASSADADEGLNEEEDDSDDEEEKSGSPSSSGFVLDFDAARKIAQGLGARLEELSHVVEVKGDKARLLAVHERTKHLFGKAEGVPRVKKAAKKKQMTLFGELESAAEAQGWGEVGAPKAGTTTLDRVHQAMLLFGAGRGEALKRFLVEEGVGKQPQFWKLAQSLSALYPSGTDEKRWVDGVLARKKGLGF
ncbi:DUF1156 domain-containing protein [Archangium minus]|uniref:DUF1156 domain-containing protein n=1 Tax=Archangium minus TaxID=83450 RepID=A0ABY9X0E2_9BACT|nr:DUF1156 domain-containing protein [Archangium minus]